MLHGQCRCRIDHVLRYPMHFSLQNVLPPAILWTFIVSQLHCVNCLCLTVSVYQFPMTYITVKFILFLIYNVCYLQLFILIIHSNYYSTLPVLIVRVDTLFAECTSYAKLVRNTFWFIYFHLRLLFGVLLACAQM
jgi:hypothetical protein